jgi:hypothetical protein
MKDDDKRSHADILVDIVLSQDIALFHTPDHVGYAEFTVNGHRECWRLRSQVFKRWIGRLFYQEMCKVCGDSAMADALQTLEGFASYEGEERIVHLRLAEHEGAIYLDLCDDQWRVVRINASGWDIINRSPIPFRRTRGMQSLPPPAQGGTIDSLRALLNITNDTNWVLIMAWLIGALRPRGPYPMLVLHGEQGTSKSWTGKTLRSFVDPNLSGLRGEPKDCRDLMIAANNGWVLAFDNLSYIDAGLSDGLCRLATGGGLATRELYTDTDETILNAQRPLLITSIEEICTRGDLLDRSIMVQLEPIPQDRRREELSLDRELDAIRPSVLGALLDGVAAALHNHSNVKLRDKPRMADFACWVTAAESGLGWQPETFIATYAGNREETHEIALEASVIGPIVRAWFEDQSTWSGTATDLLTRLSDRAGSAVINRKWWPTGPRQLSGQLRRLAPNLRAVGIDITFHKGTSSKRTRIITLKSADSASDASTASDLWEEDICPTPLAGPNHAVPSLFSSPLHESEILANGSDGRTQPDAANPDARDERTQREEVINRAD